MRYEYIIGYKKGVDNQAADSLSRVTEFQFSQFLLHMLIGGGSFKMKWQMIHSLRTWLIVHLTAAFLYRDGVWLKKGKIYLSHTFSLLQDIIMECHSSPT
jgi:hypothetical protein